jgi:hypothetical protein
MDKLEIRNLKELVDEVNKLGKAEREEDFPEIVELFRECGLDELLEEAD